MRCTYTFVFLGLCFWNTTGLVRKESSKEQPKKPQKFNDARQVAIKIKRAAVQAKNKIPIPLSKLGLYSGCLSGLVILRRSAVPLGRRIYQRWVLPWRQKQELSDDPQYKDSAVYNVAGNLSAAAEMGTYMYFVHIVVRVVEIVTGSVLLPPGSMIKVAKVIYTIWGANQLRLYKKTGLGMLLQRDPDRLGKAGIYGTITDVLLFTLVLVSVADTVGIELGPSVKSIFALAGLGTGVLALACQGMATQLLVGLELVTSDKFREGDIVQVGNVVTGEVVEIGWMETSIRTQDEVVTRLSNAIFGQEQLTNLSRETNCRVVEKLAFSYDDLEKIPMLVDVIRAKLIGYCPALVADGSRPFVVTWSGFRQDHLEVLVEAHFLGIPPMGEAYHENK